MAKKPEEGQNVRSAQATTYDLLCLAGDARCVGERCGCRGLVEPPRTQAVRAAL
jgi:hypothetical protein